MMRKLLLSSLALTVVALTLSMPSMAAGLYKCNGANNVPVYQNEPCAPGKEIRNLSNADLISVIPPSELTKQAVRDAAKQPRVQSTPRDDDAVSSSASREFTPPPVRHVPDKNDGNVAQERKSITAGMTRADVLARLGPPAMTAGDDSDPRAEMRWVYLPTRGDPDTITTIYLNGNAVAAVERKLKN